MTQPLAISAVSKSYGALKALDDVSLSVLPGEIHAVLGENGAGKSTLMGVLSGFVVPDRGDVTLDGRPLALGQPFEIKHAGIEMVHQHFMLVPAFTVAENLALYRLERLAGGINAKRQSEGALELGKELGWQIDPAAHARDLAVGAQQRVEILKALSGDAHVIILDEPTAVLSAPEVEDLFGVLRKLRDQGKTVILIAHKLKEVMRVADRVTVLRKGRVIGSDLLKNVDDNLLALWMVGGMPPLLEKPPAQAEPGLAARNLRVRGNLGQQSVRGVSFEVGKGEILGIGGVDGNGQVELAEAVAQVQAYQGELTWKGAPLEDSGVALGYIPGDRQLDGLALRMSVSDNLLIQGYRKPELSVGPFLSARRVSIWAKNLVERFGIVVGSISSLAGSLSGGNQQKVVVARTLESTPEFLVAVNPTRGLDIQATNYVHSQLLKAKANGAAVLMFTTDLEELSQLADRTLFMTSGAFAEGLGAESMVGGA